MGNSDNIKKRQRSTNNWLNKIRKEENKKYAKYKNNNKTII